MKNKLIFLLCLALTAGTFHKPHMHKLPLQVLPVL